MQTHICHITEYCHSCSQGGTERYILELIRRLPTCTFKNNIGWICSSNNPIVFISNGVEIVPINSTAARTDLPSADLEKEIRQRLFDQVRPDILHFHTFGMAEAKIAEIAAKEKIPYVFTYHSPAWSCRQGSLLRWGRKVCDGEVRTWRCSACKLHERTGIPSLLIYGATFLSFLFGHAFERWTGGCARRRTAFVLDTKRFRKGLRKFLKNCSLVVSCCNWSTPLLLKNNADPDSIFYCPQGAPMDFVCRDDEHRNQAPYNVGPNFVVGYVGRLTPAKGVHILAEAFHKIKDTNVRLKLIGAGSSRHTEKYIEKIRSFVREDPRVELLPKVSLEEVFQEYQKLSLVAIPSICLETGPLVLFEALQLNIPVLGSDRVGQLKLLAERGQVVSPNTPKGWKKALEEIFRLHRQGSFDRHFQTTCPPLRTMNDVSMEMAELYEKLKRQSRNPMKNNVSISGKEEG